MTYTRDKVGLDDLCDLAKKVTFKDIYVKVASYKIKCFHYPKWLKQNLSLYILFSGGM